MKNHRRQGGPVGRRRTPTEIATILQNQRQSGLSLLAFARKHQLCYASLIRWRRRPPKVRRPAGSAPAAPGFIPIQIETGSSGSHYELSWPGGRRLRIPPQFDSQALRRLLDMLEERA